MPGISIESPGLAVVVPAYNEGLSIEPTLSALHNQHLSDNVMHIVVDNASTDNTREVVEKFRRDHDGFPLVVIEENEKGTGCAVDTGFRYAIEYGHDVIARTDADTLPKPNWTEVITDNFSNYMNLRLLGGKQLPRTDDGWYRWRDSILWPLGIAVGRTVDRINRGDEAGKVVGNNMATSANTYLQTGGFPRTSIKEMDEDGVYEQRVRTQFGHESIKLDSELRVETSMRRLRELGYVGLALHRLHPEGRANSNHAIDIRPAVLAAQADSR